MGVRGWAQGEGAQLCCPAGMGWGAAASEAAALDAGPGAASPQCLTLPTEARLSKWGPPPGHPLAPPALAPQGGEHADAAAAAVTEAPTAEQIQAAEAAVAEQGALIRCACGALFGMLVAASCVIWTMETPSAAIHDKSQLAGSLRLRLGLFVSPRLCAGG